jgi:hypothetical protein
VSGTGDFAGMVVVLLIDDENVGVASKYHSMHVGFKLIISFLDFY